MTKPSINCPFCRAESWHGPKHQTSCPIRHNEELCDRLVHYRRFLIRLRHSHIHVGTVVEAITDFLKGQAPKNYSPPRRRLSRRKDDRIAP